MAQKDYKQNHYVQTIEWINKIKNLYPNEQSFFQNSSNAIGGLQLLAKSYQDLKQYDKSGEYFNQLLTLTIQRLGQKHFSVVTAYYGLGSLSL